jgi:hypothetical protein
MPVERFMSLVPRRTANAAIVAGTLTLACASFVRAAPVDAYLPKSGVINAKLMVIAGSPEAEQLSQKFQAAVAKNKAWFMGYVKKHEKDPGDLPYDPRFGVTKDEYDRIAHPKLQLKEIGQLKITVKTDAKGAKILDVPANAKALSGISVAAGGTRATSPAGDLQPGDDIHNADTEAPTGAWNGVSFHTDGDPQHGEPAVLLAFGKREKEADGILYYRQSGTSQGQAREVVLLYPLD